jgi:hypothetical protein
MVQEAAATNLSKISSDTERFGFIGAIVGNSPPAPVCYKSPLDPAASGLNDFPIQMVLAGNTDRI